jgi:hypothetical protein
VAGQDAESGPAVDRAHSSFSAANRGIASSRAAQPASVIANTTTRASSARRDVAERRWDAYYGDRAQDLVLTTLDRDLDDIVALLDTCLLTDDELAEGPDVWRGWPDPIRCPPGSETNPSSSPPPRRNPREARHPSPLRTGRLPRPRRRLRLPDPLHEDERADHRVGRRQHLPLAVHELARSRDAAATPSPFATHRQAIEADPELARLETLRRRRFGPPPSTEPPHLDASGHRRALLDAGFTEVVELWRHLDLALLAAVR